MDNDLTQLRVKAVEQALAAHAKLKNDEADVADLLADIMHYCRAKSSTIGTFSDHFRRASSHFCDENAAPKA